MSSQHRIRLPAPWTVTQVPGLGGWRCERWFQAPTGLLPTTKLAFELVLGEAQKPADRPAHAPDPRPTVQRLAIEVNGQALAVTSAYPGTFQAIIPQAHLLPRNHLSLFLVNDQTALSEKWLEDSWLGLTLTDEGN